MQGRSRIGNNLEAVSERNGGTTNRKKNSDEWSGEWKALKKQIHRQRQKRGQE